MPAAALWNAGGSAAADAARLVPVAFADLPGWRTDDHLAAFQAFSRSAAYAAAKPYRSGALGISFDSFLDAYDEARRHEIGDRTTARLFFERRFVPCRIDPCDGGEGFVTGYYEPELDASPCRTDRYRVPLYRRPDDLVAIDDANRPPGFDPYHAFGRRTAAGIAEYHDRAAIEAGALAGRGLEIAWLADPVDAFFVHVQGAARLTMPDGAHKRVTYAAKSGHRFTGPGRMLAEMGEIPREQVTMQTIRAWFSRHPERIDEILQRNRSFIFFRETPIGDPRKGPVAAAKVQLEPGRSLAVDRGLHTFGTPFFVEAPGLTAVGGQPFRRLMIAQDTGSAILGPARGDIFVGSGREAGEIAGIVKHKASFFALLPRALAGGAE